MKKKRGVTLVELLVVIAIIGFLSAISLPAYNTIKKKAAEKTLENKVSMLEVAAYNYGNDNKNDVAANPSNYFAVTIEHLIEEGYLSSESEDGNFIINPVTGLSMTETVTITYENYRIKAKINDGTSGLILIVLTDGGTWAGVSPKTMLSNTTTTINAPTKSNYTFTGWTVEGEGSSINGTTFTMGTKSTVLTANWALSYYNLTVNANGGTYSGQTPISIQSGATASITALPLRSGYIFNGWTVSGAGSSMNGTTFTMGTANATITANWVSYSNMFTYTVSGNPGVPGVDYEVMDETNYNWKIRFLKSGIFKPLFNMTIDVFVVGGGGGGGGKNPSEGAGGGGGGGYTGTWANITLVANQSYEVVIGAGGSGGSGATVGGTGGTSSFNAIYSKTGGAGGSATANYTWSANAGGIGGSGGGASGHYDGGPQIYGGTGGSDGSAGSPGAAGQGATTREFGEAGGTLYAGGGGGAAERGDSTRGPGGAGGGGAGGGSVTARQNGTANTGGGGGGAPDSAAGQSGGNGGSGIVIIRNHR